MKNFAIIENDKVTNVIACESQEIAEEITNSECLETTKVPWIDWTRIDGEWHPPMPQEIEDIKIV
jgi:hypothetical protein